MRPDVGRLRVGDRELRDRVLGGLVRDGGGGTCEPCPAGSYSDHDAASECMLCSNGTASAAGSTGCSSCEPGTYAHGGSACTPCPKGSFSSVHMAMECEICPTGTYQPKSGQSACLALPPGYATTGGAIGVVNLTEALCPDGEYAASASECTPAEPGHTPWPTARRRGR